MAAYEWMLMGFDRSNLFDIQGSELNALFILTEYSSNKELLKPQFHSYDVAWLHNPQELHRICCPPTTLSCVD